MPEHQANIVKHVAQAMVHFGEGDRCCSAFAASVRTHAQHRCCPDTLRGAQAIARILHLPVDYCIVTSLIMKALPPWQRFLHRQLCCHAQAICKALRYKFKKVSFEQLKWERSLGVPPQ